MDPIELEKPRIAVLYELSKSPRFIHGARYCGPSFTQDGSVDAVEFAQISDRSVRKPDTIQVDDLAIDNDFDLDPCTMA